MNDRDFLVIGLTLISTGVTYGFIADFNAWSIILSGAMIVAFPVVNWMVTR